MLYAYNISCNLAVCCKTLQVMGIVIYVFHNLSIITVCVVSSRDVTPFSDSVVFGVWVGNVHTYTVWGCQIWMVTS